MTLEVHQPINHRLPNPIGMPALSRQSTLSRLKQRRARVALQVCRTNGIDRIRRKLNVILKHIRLK